MIINGVISLWVFSLARADRWKRIDHFANWNVEIRQG
jgi:hypothetical protein